MADLPDGAISALLARYGLRLELLPDGATIPGSFWGEPEAGIVGNAVLARRDTPLHSILHEACHLACLHPGRRERVHTDAGSDDLEEAAVCYLQILLADYLPGVGRDALMRDMDACGYSFRLGSSRRWFDRDAADARAWLQVHGLLDDGGRPAFERRKSA
ncbi:MAG: hypothetical protein R3288_08295 [Woeseiaceae bacterium]|nr:hypothetical protein [Woeseiaceae bacterium]